MNILSPELGINTWEYQEYEEPGTPNGHPLIIPLRNVHCQLSRGTLDYTDPPLWITTTMDRVSEVECGFPLVAYKSTSIQLRSLHMDSVIR